MGVRTIFLSSLLAGVAGGLLQAAFPAFAVRATASELRFEVAQAPVDENDEAGARKIRSYTKSQASQVGAAVEQNDQGARKPSAAKKARRSRSMATRDRKQSR